MNKSKLEIVFKTVPEFSTRLMYYLGATYTSMLVDPSIINYKLSRKQKSRYLNPIKDISISTQWIKDLFEQEYSTMLVGKDALNLLERIKDPIKYWQDKQQDRKLTIWLAIYPTKGTVSDYKYEWDRVHVQRTNIVRKTIISFTKIDNQCNSDYTEESSKLNTVNINLKFYVHIGEDCGYVVPQSARLNIHTVHIHKIEEWINYGLSGKILPNPIFDSSLILKERLSKGETLIGFPYITILPDKLYVSISEFIKPIWHLQETRRDIVKVILQDYALPRNLYINFSQEDSFFQLETYEITIPIGSVENYIKAYTTCI